MCQTSRCCGSQDTKVVAGLYMKSNELGFDVKKQEQRMH
jgi:hypothetical protein